MRMREVLPLKLAEVTFPPGHPNEGEQGPVLAFAVVHESGVLLFDTGVGEGEREVDEWFRPVRHDMQEALASHGIALTDIVAVANSHLHFDHSGQNRRFPGVPIYVQRAERRASEEPDYTVPDWVDFPGASYEVLDGEASVLPGVRLLPTPGHTPGHQSLAVDTPEGSIVIAGQAVYTVAEWEGATDPRLSGQPSAWNPEVYARSVERLRSLNPRHVLFSHDERRWSSSS
jgi:N-acyl homoserine lactone hydrolase